jgi:beta-galactosidase/beta-glucuronidase
LHFGAVDWEATVWVNDVEQGTHKGGYDAFCFDITDALIDGKEQTITVSVWDPTDSGEQPRGKQVLEPHGIWYTAVTGIWQTVWLEPVEKNHGYIGSIKMIPDIDDEVIRVIPQVMQSQETHKIVLTASSENKIVAKYEGAAQEEIILDIPEPRLWTSDDPFLYDLEITLVHDNQVVDQVSSYFGMRKISLARDEQGTTRMVLNNEFLFQFGPLDQGWWPDGLYTAPTDEALRYDIEVTKQLGYNMARKHVKIEPQRWYYWCDKLGLLVWQDMPSGGEYIDPNEPDAIRSEGSAAQFETELLAMLNQRGNHPSIIVWVPFNEGWGQYDTERITNLVAEADPSRLVNPASGWADRKVGDIYDIHAYPGPAMPEPEEKRAVVLGEFGGLGLPLEGHTWQSSDNWGYRNYKNKEELKEAYTSLIRELQPMIGEGLSAAVYTQTTDVEVEVNGLMTYDRAVIKIDPENMQKINKAYLPANMLVH